MPDQPNVTERRAKDAKPSRWPVVLAVMVLTYLVCIVFFPILGFEFSDLDVPTMVYDNPHIRGLTAENMKHIFTSWCVISYYPVRTVTYAIDYQLWGPGPKGFKLANGLIHLANVLLVFWLVLRFCRWPGGAGNSSKPWWDVCVAAFSAGFFAIHPAVVEPVAWVGAREELLTVLGALGCIHFHIWARRLAEEGAKTGRVRACHAAAGFWCVVASLSSAGAVVIPFLITAWDLLMLRRPRFWKIVSGTSFFWVCAVAVLLLKVMAPGHDRLWADSGPYSDIILELMASNDTIEATSRFSAERMMLSINVYWLSVRTVIWPMNLALMYWKVEPKGWADPAVMLGIVALGLTAAAMWRLRRRKLALVGLLWFGLALGPSLQQIIPSDMTRADRFLYLPLVGLVTAIGMGLQSMGNLLKGRTAITGAIAAGAMVLALLAVRSISQVQTWQDNLSIWKNCVDVSPKNIIARLYYSENLAISGQIQAAQEQYAQALRMDPKVIASADQLALEMATCSKEELRDYDMAIRLARHACDVSGGQDAGYLRTLGVAHFSFAQSLADRGELDSAAENVDIAIAAIEKALGVALAAGDKTLADELGDRLKLYRASAEQRQVPQLSTDNPGPSSSPP